MISRLPLPAALFVLACAAFQSACSATPPEIEKSLSCGDCSLVLISIDTLRADHLGSYGYSRSTSPRIDEFAREAIVFERAFSSSFHTAESHMSVFTSLHPSVHGVRNAERPDQGTSLSEAATTLVEVLAEAGLTTAGFHAGGNVSRPYGFGRGFAEYRFTDSEVRPALDWLGERGQRPQERFFLFFHTYRPHDPYLPPPPFNQLWEADYQGGMITDSDNLLSRVEGNGFAEKRALFWKHVDAERPEDLRKVVALYDGGIRQVDGEVGALLELATSLPQRTLVVLISDHGEEFMEHGRFLHDQLYDPLLHVPLIVRHPAGFRAGDRIEEEVSLLDLAPTLLDLLGLPPLPQAQGRSLVPLLEGRAAAQRRPVYSEKVMTVGDDGSPAASRRALRLEGWKLIHYASGRSELFRPEGDGGEQVELSASEPDRVEQLVRLIDRISTNNSKLRQEFRSGGPGGDTALDPETVEQLRALGYL